MEYKVYRLNEVDWVAATNFDQALEWYMNDTGMDKEEALDTSYSPYEVELNDRFLVEIERYMNEELENDYLEDEDDNYMFVPASVLLEKESRERSKRVPFIFCSSEL